MIDDRVNFCTLFNIKYLTRGVAMYESLLKHCKNFHLYIFCFDEETYTILNSEKLANVTLITLDDFENDRLLSVKEDRSLAEYCWTSTPFTILYCLQNYNIDCCTYIDADIYFFSSPRVLLREVQEASILISPHRYTPIYDQSEISGKYCIQFNTFFDSVDGLTALNWWADACVEWCYAIAENNKFGDQKYLDDWVDRFSGVCELTNLGGGVAPWNVQQYSFTREKSIEGVALSDHQRFTLIFYHFHGLAYISNELVTLGSYVITDSQIKIIYAPYIRHLESLRIKFKITEEKLIKEKTKKLTFKDIYNRVSKNPRVLLEFLSKKRIVKRNSIWINEL